MSRKFPVLAALLVVVTAATAERPGYLAAGRVAPLRFAVDPAASRFVLPPLPADPAPPNIQIPTNSTTTCVTQATTTASSAEPSEGSPAATTDLTPAANQVDVTPQMLAGYYRDGAGGTNHEAGAIVPFGFVPPVTGPHPSSSASYSSP